MRLTKQTRIFARQVQVDLLALSDNDLFQMIHLWADGKDLFSSFKASAEVRSALGYTLLQSESPDNNVMEEEDTNTKWLAPTPQHLRSLLEKMDTQNFVTVVLPLAFEALHSTHPEWGEEGTFHAHLANYLRRVHGAQRV